ncbi:protein of unknown function [Micromonospora pallida]|uniref:DUF4253 domain-containing protein n=1 Tax=Micromonospora pallida TaxID=145854 RepID=A0A1C6TH59_9ACTN|nr:DUF4253 domain-containing protein [Micromonospora pallida]SCL41064.1 protein of unknown function [Micromonospora pallida]
MITDLPRLVDALPAGMLPPGRLVTPEDGGPPPYWLSDAPVEPALWARLRSQHPESGLWPLVLSGLSLEENRPWVDGEVRPARMSSPDRHDPAELLAGWWDRGQSDDDDPEAAEATAPFGVDWPGPAESGEPAGPAEEFADEYVDFLADGKARLGLVPAARGADALVVTGWTGPTNFTNDSGKIAAVVRSWEERFGARVVGLGFDTLHLSVAAPPTSPEHALWVAAEHFACCPDNIWQGSGTLTAYAEQILGVHSWSFWWD